MIVGAKIHIFSKNRQIIARFFLRRMLKSPQSSAAPEPFPFGHFVCFHSLKNGVTQTYGAGVSHTDVAV